MENVFLFSNVVSVDLKNFMLGCMWRSYCGYTAFSTAYPRLKDWLEFELSQLLRLGRSLLLSLEHFTIISLVSNADFPVYSVSQIYPNITNMDVIFTVTDTKKQGDPALEHRIKLVHLSHITVFQALLPPSSKSQTASCRGANKPQMSHQSPCA